MLIAYRVEDRPHRNYGEVEAERLNGERNRGKKRER